MRLHGRGYLATALVLGCRAVELSPNASRAAALVDQAAHSDAPLLSQLARYADATTADPETQLQAAAVLMTDGYSSFGIDLRLRAVRALRESDPARADAEFRHLVELTEHLGGAYRDLIEPFASRPQLTAREREVAELAGSGLSNVEIARRLVVSVRTVENHLHRTFTKLGVQNRQALAAALQNTL